MAHGTPEYLTARQHPSLTYAVISWKRPDADASNTVYPCRFQSDTGQDTGEIAIPAVATGLFVNDIGNYHDEVTASVRGTDPGPFFGNTSPTATVVWDTTNRAAHPGIPANPDGSWTPGSTGLGTATVTWNAVGGASGYKLWSPYTDDTQTTLFPRLLAIVLGGGTTTWTSNPLSDTPTAGNYEYFVTAFDAGGLESWESEHVVIVPFGGDPECTFTIAPAAREFDWEGLEIPGEATEGTVAVTVTPPEGGDAGDCDDWDATLTDTGDGVDWITIVGPSSGSGSGTLTYTLTENEGTAERSATIVFTGDNVHTITQQFCDAVTRAFFSVQGPVPSRSKRSAVTSFDFPTPATEWTIDHNLGHIPAFDVTVDGEPVLGGYTQSNPSMDQSILTFPVAVAGSAKAR